MPPAGNMISPDSEPIGRAPVSSRPPTRRLRILLYGMTAAASVILVTMFLWPSTKADYIGQLGHTQMISGTERGENADTLLQKASVYFNHEEFRKALLLLDQAVKADSASQQALFYRGPLGMAYRRPCRSAEGSCTGL